MNRKLFVAALAVIVPVSALQAMTVALFLEKADALQARGALALFSSDLSLLRAR